MNVGGLEFDTLFNGGVQQGIVDVFLFSGQVCGIAVRHHLKQGREGQTFPLEQTHLVKHVFAHVVFIRIFQNLDVVVQTMRGFDAGELAGIMNTGRLRLFQQLVQLVGEACLLGHDFFLGQRLVTTASGLFTLPRVETRSRAKGANNVVAQAHHARRVVDIPALITSELVNLGSVA